MIKKISTLILMFSYLVSYSQNITAFSDANNRLYLFNEGQISLIEFQKTTHLQIANNYIAYADSRGDYWVNWKGKKMRIAQGPTIFHETNNLLVAHFTSMLKVVDTDKIKTLTSFVNSFAYGDSIVVFQDKIGGNLKYYYQDTIVEFSQLIGSFYFSPQQIGDNVFAYGDNAGNFFAFQNHHFYPLFSANGNPIFSAGLNVIAYNDLENFTFSVFKNGEIIDIDSQFALNYKAGHNFVYYMDQSENQNVYYNGEITELGYDLQNLVAHDSVITYTEAGYFKIWFDDEIHTIYNTQINNYQVDGGIVAYKTNKGGVNAFIRGKEIEITGQNVSNFWLNGNTIVVQYSASSFGVWWNHKMYTF